MKGNWPLPELLAPVGGRAQLEAAVNHGADAVYMGGSLFNARINAENFTDETLADAIGFAHERDVKVYITFNTLVKDSELERAFRYACFLYEIGADALILQDMGLARLIHKYLPDFPLHLSTQGTVYNVQALDLVRQLGFCRVVPARELTMEEIRKLCAAAHGAAADDTVAHGAPVLQNAAERGTASVGEAPLEIEVFVHGALCMCYSGQCQMSRAFGGGGRSGNRGLCAQPCRLPYTDDKGRTGYFLSPKDLCTLELMPQLIEAGVDSFKIEGRLKSPEYVAVTTSVYRKYLDLYAQHSDADAPAAGITSDEWKKMIDPADMQKLKRAFNRGGFTTGYLEGNPGRKILSGESPKNQGVYVGVVESVRQVRSSSASRDKVLVDVTLKGSHESIARGDGVEIRDRASGVTTGNVVTYVEQQPGGTLRIGDFDRGIRAGDRVYKVTDKALREEALSVPSKKIPVGMRFLGKVGQAPELALLLGDEPCGARAGSDGDSDSGTVRVCGDFAVEKALKRPLTEEKIRSQLMKLGDTCFAAGEEDIEVDTDPDIMIPVSVINQMRREAADALAGMLRAAVMVTRTPLPEGSINEIFVQEQLGNEDELRRVEESAVLCNAELVPVEEFYAKRMQQNKSDNSVLPYILNVSKGELDDLLEQDFDAIAEAVRNTGILVGNLGWIKQFLDAGVTVYGDYGLNAYNSQCVKAYEELGVKMVFPSHECYAGERGAGMKTSDPRFGGRVPLMITEHPFGTDHLIDRKGAVHEIIKRGDKYIIL